MIEHSYGWVIRLKGSSPHGKEGNYYSRPEIPSYHGTLENALVIRTRFIARILKNEHETIDKVSLYKSGRPKKVIGRG